MSSLPTDLSLGRRDFLKGSLLAGGGLLIGISLGGCAKPAPTGPGGSPVAWLHIAADNSITILIDKSEMGQGVYT